MKRKFFSFCY